MNAERQMEPRLVYALGPEEELPPAWPEQVPAWPQEELPLAWPERVQAWPERVPVMEWWRGPNCLEQQNSPVAPPSPLHLCVCQCPTMAFRENP